MVSNATLCGTRGVTKVGALLIIVTCIDSEIVFKVSVTVKLKAIDPAVTLYDGCIAITSPTLLM